MGSISGWLGAALLAALATTPPPPVGVYRTAAQFRRGQPAPAGADVRPSDKRRAYVVQQGRGGQHYGKVQVPYDSVWGYVNDKGVAYRRFNGDEYLIESVDTLTIYSNNSPNRNAGTDGPAVHTYATGKYYFSRGLTGLIFPLTEKYLREAYEASNPAFVAAVKNLGVLRSLSDLDKKTGVYRAQQLYHDSLRR